ncbi:hypothetical protein HY634_03915 [Candidatus Uhrbacteria bacterium]|nr:hypothetical protein [Candidatus Uhrbacteria bacterium]
MPFPVTIRRDCSLNDLATIHRSGGSVMKSPHIGNMYPNNLAVGALGIPLNCYDRTIGRKDRNFHPHRVICGGRSEVIALDGIDRLTTHAIVDRPSQLAPEWFSVGTRVADGHMAALRAALPTAECVTYTDWLRERADRITAVLEVITDAFPSIWERLVTPDGHVVDYRVRNWAVVQQIGVYGVTSDAPSGLIVPNVVNILLDGVLECLSRGVTEVYHCSGPDMVRYIGELEAQLHTLYDTVRTRLGWGLPDTLRFHLVPVAEMRFVVPERRRAALDELVASWCDVQALKRIQAERMREATDDERQDAITACVAARDRSMARVRDAIVACPEIFYRIEDANCTTQYDLLAEQETVYVPPWAAAAPMRDIDDAMGFFRRADPRQRLAIVSDAS